MSKQVDKAADQQPATSNSHSSSNLYFVVRTFDAITGHPMGERIVDLYHYGTNNWLAKHNWWAMHNGHSIELQPASPDEVSSYLAEAALTLAAKYNEDTSTVEAIAA